MRTLRSGSTRHPFGKLFKTANGGGQPGCFVFVTNHAWPLRSSLFGVKWRDSSFKRFGQPRA
jgi:hypothetical protein